MSTIQPLWKTDPVQYLVLWKFPQIAVFRHAAVRESSSLTNDQWREIQRKVDEYRQELSSLPQSDLEELLAIARADEAKRAEEYRANEERQRFFNKPGADADIQYWASASYWTLDEASALSFGKDPRIVKADKVLPLVNVSPFANEFAARRELLMRAKAMGQLWDRTSPAVLLAWAERMRFPIPDAMRLHVEDMGLQIADWKTLHDQVVSLQRAREELIETQRSHIAEKEREASALRQHVEVLKLTIDQLEADIALPRDKSLASRERESLLKLIIGMAIKGYGYDPSAARTSKTIEIAGDLDSVGLPMTDDTVRKYLYEAKELLPRE